LRNGASTYEALVAGLGTTLVNSIFGEDYFDNGDGGGVYTASFHGVPYTQHILSQLSAANLPADCTSLRVRLLNGKYESLKITDLNIYELLSALYAVKAMEIVSQYNVQAV